MNRIACSRVVRGILIACVIDLYTAATIRRPDAHAAEVPAAPEKYPAKLVESLEVGGDEFVEVTAAGTLRRRYRVWGDFDKELAAWKNRADTLAKQRTSPPRTFRLGGVFLKDAQVTFPDVPGRDGRPVQATFTTPPDFERSMREKLAQQYADFTWAFTQGEVRCEWVFETLSDLKWRSTGKSLAWGCQPRGIGDQLETALARHKESQVDMWVWCAGQPVTENGTPTQKVTGPPYGISYTQWQIFGGYNIVICAPHLPLIVHEVNHRYLDNLNTIEGEQLTLFHGLSAMGYESRDLGYPDLLAVYRSVYLHVIRPAMWRRFTLVGPNKTTREPFAEKRYRWSDVADDCWFRLPLLGEAELAKLTGLPSLKLHAERKTTWRHLTVSESDREKLKSPYLVKADESDVALNNFLNLKQEASSVLRTETGHWLIVRPEVAEVFVRMGSIARRDVPELEVVGWMNEGVRPLLVLRAPPDTAVPEHEIGYFR